MIRTDVQLMDYIQQVGFLPLLESGVKGFSADESIADECRYYPLPEGGWEWKLWDWKGPIVREGHVAYGKFFNKKAGFVSLDWWPDFVNYRRSRCPFPSEGSVEETILWTLREQGSLITRELRAACGFDGPKMRSRFDAYITRLEMGGYIVTEDFVYPRDKHNREYGWGWSLLTTPESLFGKGSLSCNRTPEESLKRMQLHLEGFFPNATARQWSKLLEL